MALQVWLPGINGTLLNQGLYKLPNPSYNSMSEFTLGKLGKAIKGNAIYHLSSDIFGDKWSVTCWIKFISGYSQYNNIILCLNTYESEDSKFYLSIVNNTYLNIGRGSSSGVTYPLSGGFIIDTWYHVAATCDGTKTSLYLNGNLVNSGNVGSVKSALNLGIGCRSTNNTGTNITGFSWPMNDIRIYDHCLSPKEVHEIAKGLVLHYKLDDIYSESTTNIASSLNPQLNVGGWGIIISTKIDTNYYHIKHYYGSSSNPSHWSTFVYTLPSSYANKIITFSAKLKNINYHDINNTTSWIFFGQGNNGTYPTHGSATYYINQLYENIQLVWTGTLNNTNNYLVFEIWSNDLNTNGTIELDLYNIQIEEKNHTTGYVNGTRTATTIYDCSGYKNHGTIAGILNISTDTPRYNYCTQVLETGRIIYPFPKLQELTYSFWFKRNRISYSNREMLMTGWYGLSFELNTNNTLTFRHYLNSSGTWDIITSKTFNSTSDWYFITFTRNSSGVSKIYVNGILDKSGTNTNTINYTSSTAEIYTYSGTSYQFRGNISDFRIYATALSDVDIKELYDTPTFIDNQGDLLTYEFDEHLNNMIDEENYGIIKKQWLRGLSKYTQQNCQCTLENDGYRIYRPANLTTSANGNTMRGGFVLDNTNNRFGLATGHTYIIEFEVKGKSSNAVTDVLWSNNVGWGGGGLTPAPTNVTMINPVVTNFNTSEWKYFSYRWTISDSVYKTCTSAYSSFVVGETYVSYRHFKFGYGYSSTGELGTDIYIRNIRMYDITSNIEIMINKTGIVDSGSFIEDGIETQFFKDKIIKSTQLLEI